MAKSRFKNRKTFINKEETYEELVESRGREKIEHFTTPVMSYPSENLRSRITEAQHLWSHGDKYWKLSAKYYKDPKYWWIIAWYNLKPTDSHCKIGDTILVPLPLTKILKYYGY